MEFVIVVTITSFPFPKGNAFIHTAGLAGGLGNARDRRAAISGRVALLRVRDAFRVFTKLWRSIGSRDVL